MPRVGTDHSLPCMQFVEIFRRSDPSGVSIGRDATIGYLDVSKTIGHYHICTHITQAQYDERSWDDSSTHSYINGQTSVILTLEIYVLKT